MKDDALLTSVIQIAKKAGQEIKSIYENPTRVTVEFKADQSPVTVADLAAEQIISNGLKTLPGNYPIISEEAPTADLDKRRSWEHFWLVDPLDGTEEFITRTDEFTINIALVQQHKPVLGIVYSPILETCYFARKGEGAFKQFRDEVPQAIRAKPYRGGPIKVVASRHHGLEQLKSFLQKLDSYVILHAGSALKLCMVAEGEADIYPRFGPTSEWDTAAAQCVIEEAGGKVLGHTGQELLYNTQDSLLNPHFIAVGDASYVWQKYLN